MEIFLETERMLLRRLLPADAENLAELDSDPEVMRYLTGGRPTPLEVVKSETLPKMLAYYQRPGGLGYWAAIEKSTGQFMGWFEFRPRQADDPTEVELGYRLRRQFWGKGYATEGSRALIRKGFTELGVRYVYATTMTVNQASRRVMEKAGLKLVRIIHQSWPDPIPGAELGDVEYGLSRNEWEQSSGLP